MRKMDITIINRICYKNLVWVNYPQVKSITFLVSKMFYNNIVKRGMHLSKPSMELALQTINKNRVLFRSMSAYGLFNDEKNPKDPQALKNNPPVGLKKFKHKVVVKTTCSEKDCEQKICPPGKLCVPPVIKKKAVANTTHGTNNTSSGTNQELDPNQDYSGNSKAQRAIFYKNAHDIGTTAEIPSGTNFVNQPHVVKIIQKYEDKK